MTDAKHGIARIPTIVAYDLLSFEGFLPLLRAIPKNLFITYRYVFTPTHRRSSLAAAPMAGLRPPAEFTCTVVALSFSVVHTQLPRTRGKTCKNDISETSTFQATHSNIGNTSYSDLRLPTLATQRTPTYAFQHWQHGALQSMSCILFDSTCPVAGEHQGEEFLKTPKPKMLFRPRL